MQNVYPRLGNYTDARAHYDKTKPFRGREDGPRPIGSNRKGDKTMRLESDGSVSMLLHGNPVVTYHPDESITVKIFVQDQTTDQFGDRMLPCDPAFQYRYMDQNGLHLNALRGTLQIGPHYRIDPTTSHWTRNKDARVARCDWGNRARVVRTPDGWQFDEESLTPFDVPKIDTKRARAVSAEYRLPDFVNWFKAIEGLEQEHALPEHIDVDVNAALRLAKEGDFVEAFRYVPLIDNYCNWSRNSRQNSYQTKYTQPREIRTATSITQLRQELYIGHGVVKIEKIKILTPAQFNTMCQARKTYGL